MFKLYLTLLRFVLPHPAVKTSSVRAAEIYHPTEIERELELEQEEGAGLQV